MRTIFYVITLLLVDLSFGQGGCTDPLALNYNPAAKWNNGSCLYQDAKQPFNLLSTPKTGIVESSGLVFIDGYFFEQNDAGNSSQFYKVSPITGEIIQKITLSNYGNIDWEDLAYDSLYFYIADLGNNNGIRKDLRILKISKSQFIRDTTANVTVKADVIEVSYKDQTSFISTSTHNFDCEALIAFNDSLYLFTKNRGDYKTKVYKVSKTPGKYILTPFISFNVNGLITAADYCIKRNEIILLGYQTNHSNSFIYYLNDFQGDSFFSGNKRRILLTGGPVDWQTEGICYKDDSMIYLSCESANISNTIYKSSRNNLLTAAIRNVNKSIIILYPNPASDNLRITSQSSLGKISVFNSYGELLRVVETLEKSLEFDLKSLVTDSSVIYFKIVNQDSFGVYPITILH